LQAGGQPRSPDFVVQQCTVGLVKIRRQEVQGLDAGRRRQAFAAPPLTRSPMSPALRAQIAAALGLEAKQVTATQELNNGLVWLCFLLDSPETVLQITPDYQVLGKLDVHVGVAGVYPPDRQPQLISRASREARAFSAAPSDSAAAVFKPDVEVRGFIGSTRGYEDPVTGSLNASLAQWLMADGHAPEKYRASQGICLGRAGQVHLERDAQGQVWVGGDSVTCIDGRVTL